MTPCFATIISPNYLAYARVLADSLAQHMPGCPLQVLLVGRRGETAQAAAESGLAVTWADDLGLEGFDTLAYQFDLVEFNTALKPTFLRRLLAQGHEAVVYLDPDIRVMAPLAPVLEALQGASTVLTPHALAPVMDGQRPSDIDFLRTGAYNLGFIALRNDPAAQALLQWWESRCLGWGFNDFPFGTFVDQKWLDLAPSYFEGVRVLRHPGCNVAYWNLHERPLSQSPDGRLHAGGETLCFFHFSGVNPARPELLSRHQDRHVPVPGSLLAVLVADYCARLQAAGHERWKGIAYDFGVLQDGTPITQAMRRAALAPGVDASDPFNPASALQAELRQRGLVPRAGAAPAANTTTLNFDPQDWRVRRVNGLLRLASRVLGARRVADLVRYAAFLAWGGNLPAVLLDRPFDLRHAQRRPPR